MDGRDGRPDQVLGEAHGACFSAASNVLWVGGSGGDRRAAATTSTCGDDPFGGGRKSGAKRGGAD